MSPRSNLLKLNFQSLLLFMYSQEQNRGMEASGQGEANGDEEGVWKIQRPMGTKSSLQPLRWASQKFQ